TAAASKRTVGLTQLRRVIFSTIPGFALGAAVPIVCRGHSCKGWTGELALVRAPAGPRRWITWPTLLRPSCGLPHCPRAAAAGAWTGDATGATPAHRRAGGA